MGQAVQAGLFCPPPPPQPEFGSGNVISQFLLHHNFGIFSCKRYKHYFSKTWDDYIQCAVWLSLSKGWGASCPGWFILAPAQDLGQAVSSSNSYCTIILEYLVVRDVNIIAVKQMFTSTAQFGYPCLGGGGGGELSRLVYLAPPLPPPSPPPPTHSPQVSSANSYCTINLEYLVVWDTNIISVKLRCLRPGFSLVTLVQGVGGVCKLSRLVYFAPRPEFGSGRIISQFLLHHNLGIFSCKKYKHYFSKTEMFTSNIQLGYSWPRGVGQAVQDGLSCPPTQDLSKAVSSTNSYCTINLEYFVWDINIISVKLRYLHPKLSLAILVRGVGGQAVQAGLSWPCPGFGSVSFIRQFLLLHYLSLTKIMNISHTTKYSKFMVQ